MILKQYKSILENVNRVALTTHENPDGDGLGCAAAMYHYFSDIKKECKIMLPSPLPKEYIFLNKGSIFYEYSKEHDSWLKNVDLVIVFDVGDINRLKKIKNIIDVYNLKTLNIDHHALINSNSFSYNLVDTKAAATGEIVYDILKECFSHPLSKDIAEGIYTAIMTDTGSFKYSNTRIHTHEIAIQCYKAGIKAHHIYQQVYEKSSKNRMKLLGEVLNDLQFDCNGQLSWFTIDKNKMIKCNAKYSAIDGISDFIRTIDGVEVSIMILETQDSKCRVNFRSKGKYIVNGVAKSLGGGGHPLAAGAQINSSIDIATPIILEKVKLLMDVQNSRIK